MAFTYEYPRPSVTADVVLFTIVRTPNSSGELATLMVRRRHAPFKGHWALPGGFVEEDEGLEHAAARELQEETGVVAPALQQLGAFGDPGRDPRGHTVTVAYMGCVVVPPRPVAADDAADAQWLPLTKLLAPARKASRVAFDHAHILGLALTRLRDETAALGGLVPPQFTLSELQHVHEAVLGRQLDKRNFRAKILTQGLVEPVAAARRTGRHRPAQLYRWAEEKPRRHARR